jgi:hypothetical protein
MPLSWNEIRSRAHAFVAEWTNHPLPSQGAEKAEAQTFWNDFFEVFGKKRRHVAAFEAPVKNLTGNLDRIDLLWAGTMLAEHKSPGGNLEKAHAQGLGYIANLQTQGRDADCPRWLIVSNFTHIALHDLQPEQDPDLPLFKRIPPTVEFALADLPKMVHAFGFMAGYRTWRLKEEDPANIEAAELLAQLHDVLEAGGYPTKDIDRFLVRILFCLFAEDTGIFNPNSFTDYLTRRTKEDGSDLGTQLEQFFRVLDQPQERRQKNLDEELAELPWVNGKLFEERLEFANFNKSMRDQLLACTCFKWSQISPAVFGSLFQTIMEPRERRQIGAHYTTERDILKLVRSLFLDDLHAEFAQIKADRSSRREARLKEFQVKLSGIRLLDPACGCGNFLVIAYRELRDLEIAVLRALDPSGQHELSLEDINKLSKVDVDQLYGIEIADWPAKIAEVAVWLMDHLMNQKLSAAFGQFYRRLPLRKSARIECANALRTDWNTVLPAAQCSYVLGNPPFVGHHYQSQEQKADQDHAMKAISGNGVLDFVCNWYVKAADYLSSPHPTGTPPNSARTAFVSTNSITQGEHAGLLWNHLFQRYRIKIHFGHRTFAWTSEARGKAHVHVVIVGFGLHDVAQKRIYDYEADPAHPVVSLAKNISPYLVEGPDRAVTNQTAPLCKVPKMSWGNKPTDGGHFLLSRDERADLIAAEPGAKQFIRPYMGGQDFINNQERYCLWLKDAPPAVLRTLPRVLARVEAVRKFRLASTAASTRAYAEFPTLFRQIAQPDSEYLAIPEVSSENRNYIPIAYVSRDVICANTVQFIPGATRFHFGVLTSAMHMTWMRTVCGRLKSDYRYSNTLVYNNFPWPAPTDAQKAKVEEAAKQVLAARARHLPPRGLATLADLYDPATMPPELVTAHADLDRAVERCYRAEKFHADRERVEHLFSLYEKLTAPLLPAAAKTRGTRAAAAAPRKASGRPRTPALPAAADS